MLLFLNKYVSCIRFAFILALLQLYLACHMIVIFTIIDSHLTARPADVAYFDKEGDTAGAGHSRKVLGVLQQLTNQLMIITMKGMMKTLV